MKYTVDKLFVVKRRITFEVLFYCPSCEAINEAQDKMRLDNLACRECLSELTAEGALLELINPSLDEQ